MLAREAQVLEDEAPWTCVPAGFEAVGSVGRASSRLAGPGEGSVARRGARTVPEAREG